MKNHSIKQISQQIRTKKYRIVGISGVPGAGKSTISLELSKLIPDSIILSMDGFHIYRKDLSVEGLQRRGAPFTFNYEKFKDKMKAVFQKECEVKFPIFNHEEKDPVENIITVQQNTECIIVQGLYIFDELLKIDSIWDLRLWIQIQSEEATKRLIKRHLKTGVTSNEEQAIKRANGSDLANATYVIQNCRRPNLEYKMIINK